MWKVVKQVPRPLILIGAGNLGTALCSNYSEFEGKGLKIVAAFDNDPRKCGTELGHIKVVEHVSSIQRIAQESGAKIAILAIPGEKAQEITRLCVEAGISTILNYSPVSLNVPHHVHVEYMDPALKIQMALQSTNRSASVGSSPHHYGIHFSPFPAHILQPITPLLVPFRKYAHYNKVIVRNFSTYNNQIPPSLLHSNRYASDFEELGMLGKGGFGSVFQARNRIDRVDYAVKKVRISTHSSALHTITEHKYLREVRAMARLNHANLLRYYYAWIEFDQHAANDELCFNDSSFGSESVSAYGDALEQTSESCSFSKTHSETMATSTPPHHPEQHHVKVILYIQMELCTGFTLREWMARSDRVVHIRECHSILAQLVQGLHHIHAHGFIHRDVTPPNIFMEILANQIVVKIGDFGLAKPCGDLKKDPEVLHVGIGDKTIGVGTFLYASPEQLSNTVYDTKADMYSVGVVLFELLHPFKTQMERVCFLTRLKDGHIPPYISIQYPCETGMIESLLNKDSSQRPSAEQILARVKHMTQ